MTEDLHDLTKFILSRLESYPEEFFDDRGVMGHTKWRGALNDVQLYARPEDIRALHDAFMGHALQRALKVLLAPEDSADDPVGQSSNSSGVQGIPGGQFGGSGGPGLTRQQAQAAIAQQQAAVQQAQAQLLSGAPMPPLGTSTTVLAQQTITNLVSQAKEQQKRTVTIPTSLAKAAGLKPMTIKEQIEHWKKRLGL